MLRWLIKVFSATASIENLALTLSYFLAILLLFLGSADIGDYLVVAYFETYFGHFSDDFFWFANCLSRVCI